MKSKSEFKQIVKEIADTAFSNGLKRFAKEFAENPDLLTWSDDRRKGFFYAVHDGFKIAQLRIVSEMLELQSEEGILKSNLKKARSEGEKETVKEINESLKDISFRIGILSNIGDGIVWQLFQGQVYVIRRFYLRESAKTLVESNIVHALAVATQINENPSDFALISDITNYIQIGDLIVLKDGKIGVVELKEGKVNEELAKLKEEYFKQSEGQIDEPSVGEGLEPKKAEQLNRMIRQEKRMNDTVDILNTDSGVDVRSGAKMSILSPESLTETYDHEIALTIEELDGKSCAYKAVFGSIVHIGVYKPEMYELAKVAIPSILKDSKNKIVVDFKNIVNQLSQPLFAKSLPVNVIHDILFDDIKVILGFDIDQFFADLEKFFPITVNFLSRKETMKIKEINKKLADTIYVIDNRAIEIKHKETGKSFIMGGGMISKLVYDNISPLSIFNNIVESLKKGAPTAKDEEE